MKKMKIDEVGWPKSKRNRQKKEKQRRNEPDL
jgi:hypothetical protein